MNKIITLPALLSGLILFSGAASAQLLQFPSGNAAWEVEITYLQEGSPVAKAVATPTPEAKATPGQTDTADRKPQKIEITQVDNIKRIRITWTKGDPTEEWTIPGLPVVFIEFSNGGVSAIQSGHEAIQMEKMNMPYDSSAFNWLSPQDLQEQTPVTMLKKQCFHYKGEIEMPRFNRDSKQPTAKSVREAWIDSKTLLPVALKTDTELCSFAFSDKPPTGPLIPGPKYKAAIDNYKTDMGYP